ncbi:MAG: hypothetical protein QW403_03195 [Candidatus Aenigmatarchaeota archaeon]
MKGKTITIISVVIVLAISLTVFFYPKKCGNWGTSLEATYERCDCIGLKLQEYTLGGGYYYCYGICLQNTCKPYKFTSQEVGVVPLNGWLFTVETDTEQKLYFVSMYGQEEIERRIQIPSDIEARNILLTYMKENNIKGTISESFLFQYLVQNFDALRAALK